MYVYYTCACVHGTNCIGYNIGSWIISILHSACPYTCMPQARSYKPTLISQNLIRTWYITNLSTKDTTYIHAVQNPYMMHCESSSQKRKPSHREYVYADREQIRQILACRPAAQSVLYSEVSCSTHSCRGS